MARCEICDKSINFGNKLSITRSHISKRAPRTWKPNLRTVKTLVNGEKKKDARFLKNHTEAVEVLIDELFKNQIVESLDEII